MIIASIFGGLGNQMFQYALGRTLSVKRNVELRLDLSWYDDPVLRQGATTRRFELDRFAIPIAAATKSEICQTMRFPMGPGPVDRLARKILPYSSRTVIAERFPFGFDDAVLRAHRQDVRLWGYWQNPRYFSSSEDLIRRDFSFASPVDDCQSAVLQRIATTESVGVHVRRGDYLHREGETGSHRLQPTAYYVNAMARMRARLPAAVFYVFSDDIEWAAANIPGSFDCEFVNKSSQDTAYDGIRLMAECKHQIIANSTFSWWAAWLNNTPGKLVVAPRAWFVGDAFDVSQLMPHTWEQI